MNSLFSPHDPPPPSCPAPDPALMSPEDKKSLLTERRTLAAIRKVARSRGVPRQELEDVEQQACTRAWKARLPADVDEARRVINRIAFAAACEHMGNRGRMVRSYDEATEGEAVAAEAPDHAYALELREQVQLLLDKARARFGDRLDPFLIAVRECEDAKAEAARRNVRHDQVRRERSQIRRFMREHGQKMGLLAAMALVVLVFGSMHDWTRQPDLTGPDAWNTWAPTRHRAFEPAGNPASLRKLAVKRFQEAEFDACLQDLDAAKALDGQDDDLDEAQMRADALDNLRARDADARFIK